MGPVALSIASKTSAVSSITVKRTTLDIPLKTSHVSTVTLEHAVGWLPPSLQAVIRRQIKWVRRTPLLTWPKSLSHVPPPSAVVIQLFPLPILNAQTACPFVSVELPNAQIIRLLLY